MLLPLHYLRGGFVDMTALWTGAITLMREILDQLERGRCPRRSKCATALRLYREYRHALTRWVPSAARPVLALDLVERVLKAGAAGRRPAEIRRLLPPGRSFSGAGFQPVRSLSRFVPSRAFDSAETLVGGPVENS